MRRHLARGYEKQGVGPVQLTSVELQDEADAMGGAWIPRYNIRVGFRYLADLIDRHGETKALLIYNGASPEYAKKLQTTARSWERYFTGETSRPFPRRERRIRAPGHGSGREDSDAVPRSRAWLKAPDNVSLAPAM